jgi:hypothetical protein
MRGATQAGVQELQGVVAGTAKTRNDARKITGPAAWGVAAAIVATDRGAITESTKAAADVAT